MFFYICYIILYYTIQILKATQTPILCNLRPTSLLSENHSVYIFNLSKICFTFLIYFFNFNSYELLLFYTNGDGSLYTKIYFILQRL